MRRDDKQIPENGGGGLNRDAFHGAESGGENRYHKPRTFVSRSRLLGPLARVSKNGAY